MTAELELQKLNDNTDRLTDEVLTVKSVANASATQAKTDADRATAAQAQLGNEVAAAEAARDQAVAAAAQATSTMIGDEDYTIPAVEQLLGITGVVAVAQSDEVWAAHAYKWGAPTSVIAVATEDKVELRDATKPSLPIWFLKTRATIDGSNGLMPWPFHVGVKCRDVALAGACLVIGLDNDSQSMSGPLIVDFASQTQRRVARYTEVGGVVSSLDDNALLVHDGFVLPVDARVNCLAAKLFDGADLSTGVPMPTIAIGTDGGVHVLSVEGGIWDAVTITSTGPDADPSKVNFIDFNDRDELMVSHPSGWEAQYSSLIVGPVPVANEAASRLQWSGSRRYIPHKEDALASSAVSLGPTQQHGDVNHISAAQASRVVYRTTAGELLGVVNENPAARDSGMVAHITEEYSTPLIAGDAILSFFCDGFEGVAGGALLSNPTFQSDIEWAHHNFGTGSSAISGGECVLNGTNYENRGQVWQAFDTVVGEMYAVVAEATEVNNTYVVATNDIGGLITARNVEEAGRHISFFKARTVRSRVYLRAQGGRSAFDSVEVYHAVEDRTGRGNHAIINGALTRSKPAGSDVSVVSGWGEANNLVAEGAYESGDDICVSLLYGRESEADNELFTIADSIDSGSPLSGLHVWAWSANLKFAGQGIGMSDVTGLFPDDGFTPISVILRSGILEIWASGAKVFTSAGVWDVAGSLFVGTGYYNSTRERSISQFTATKTAPSADQIRYLHNDMLSKVQKPVLLTGAVMDVTHDPIRKQDWIACSDGQVHRLTNNGTTFEESVTIGAVGEIKSMTVNDGNIVVAGADDVWSSQKAKNLRAPVVRLGKSIKSFELGEGDGVETDVYLPYGWKPVRVFVDGIKQRKGDQDDWQPLFDGYRWFIRFAVAPGVVDIDCDAEEL